MGTYLSQPNTEKETEIGEFDLNDKPTGKNLPYAVSEMQGWRKTMEDAHITMSNLERQYDVPVGTTLFAVFDGHAGREVAAFCERHFVEELVELEAFKARAYREALVECFHRMDELIKNPRYKDEVINLKQTSQKAVMRSLRVESEDETQFVDASPEDNSLPAVSSEELDIVAQVIEVDDEEGETYDLESEFALPTEKETLKAQRAESMNLNDMKAALQENIKKAEKEKEKSNGKEPEKKPIAKVIEDEEGVPLPPNVKAKMEKAEEEGTISKSDALEIMLTMLKLNRPKSKEAKAKQKAEEEEEEVVKDADLPTMAGCTAIVALIVNNKIYVANAGDSRSVLCEKGKSRPLSFDHKPTNPGEKSRIEKAGGFVSEVGRVCGNLNLSRSIGDLRYKKNVNIHRSEQIITAEPDVTITEISDDSLFFVVACDGVWDIMTNESIVEFIKDKIVKEKVRNFKEIVESIFTRCLSHDPMQTQGLGGDNMTCIIIGLKPMDRIVQALTSS